MSSDPMLDLLKAGNWNEFQPMFDRLSAWQYYPMLLETLRDLNRDALFVSKMHGLGHIERTILQGAFCAMEEGLNAADTRLLFLACSYHDVGRVSDWEDTEHGHRSAGVIGELTGCTGEDLLILQGAVDAHSRRENELRPTVAGYGAPSEARALCIAELLKDSDGLDRVRLGDLDVRFLRREASRTRAALSQEVYDRYQAAIGMPPGPMFSEEVIEKLKLLAQQRLDERDRR